MRAQSQFLRTICAENLHAARPSVILSDHRGATLGLTADADRQTVSTWGGMYLDRSPGRWIVDRGWNRRGADHGGSYKPAMNIGATGCAGEISRP